jgi:flagellar biogenesis protein FliO
MSARLRVVQMCFIHETLFNIIRLRSVTLMLFRSTIAIKFCYDLSQGQTESAIVFKIVRNKALVLGLTPINLRLLS